MRHRGKGLLSIGALLLAGGVSAWADPVLGALPGMTLYEVGSVDLSSYYTDSYYYGALAFNGSNLLLSATDGSTSQEGIYSLSVTRDSSGHIVGLGSATDFANVSVGVTGNAIAGGMVFAPGGVLVYTTSSANYLGQYASGSSQLTALPLSSGNYLGGLSYVPTGFPDAGALKLSTVGGDWYDVSLSGTPSLIQPPTSAAAAYSFAYMPAGNRIAADSIIAADTSNLTLQLYGLDANGNPAGTGVVVVNGNGQAIGFGIARDPKTGDILFTTGNNQIWALSQTVPEPGTASLMIAAAALLWWQRRRLRCD